MRILRTFFWLLVLVQAAGCASPSQRMDERAAELGFRRVIVPGTGYDHVAYLKEGLADASSPLHVYLDGDGTPWVRKGVAAADPTPRSLLTLDLMALDAAPALYLGRPCYHGMNNAQACTPVLWTDGRYSETVVASMAAALDRLSEEYRTLVLIGYSGGGTLAMLMTERLPKTETLVTVAANLDTQRWTTLHRQPPLSGSLNPASRPPLPSHIRQMHFAGGKDDNVPPALVRDAISQQRGAVFTVFTDQDHACCWRVVWPQILGRVASD